MNGIEMRKRLHNLIDVIPDQSLSAVIPLLSFLAEEYWKPILETDLTEDERAMIAAGVEEKKRDPSSVKSWREVRRSVTPTV
jgi:hypothetical protein